MPDSPPDTWKQIIRDVLAVVQVVALAYLAGQSHQNVNRIEAVQSQVDAKAEEITTKQDHSARRTAQVQATLEARTKEEDRARGVQLYSSWKYLEDVAEAEPTKANQDAAAEAKRTYAEHLKKHDHGK